MYLFTYDDNSNRIETLYQSYQSQQWENIFRYTYSFDNNNNETISVLEEWLNEQWVYDSKQLYSYEQYTGINDLIHSDFSLNNYPNPFNPTTKISFSIPEENSVTISIYNLKGQKIKKATNEIYSQGEHSIVWNGDNESGETLSSGVYFYKLEVNGKTTGLQKMLLLK